LRGAGTDKSDQRWKARTKIVTSGSGDARLVMVEPRQRDEVFSEGHLETNHVVGLHAVFDNPPIAG
jgi:hypothetical protein